MQLAELQAAFAASLRGTPPDALLQAIAPSPAGVPAADRLAIYRRTSRHSQQGALAQVYPVVHALVGDDLFNAVVGDHLHTPGSRDGDLHRLGADFAATLLAEPACAELPYLAEMARLEWALHDSFFAADQADAALVDPGQVGAAEQLQIGLVLHPSAHVLTCQYPVHQIWQAHQPADAEPAAPDPAAVAGRLAAIDLAAGPVWLAVHRRAEGHCITPLTAAEQVLLMDARAGCPLVVSLERIETAGLPPPALGDCLARWLPAGLLEGFALR